jgi:hypothetical protein
VKMLPIRLKNMIKPCQTPNKNPGGLYAVGSGWYAQLARTTTRKTPKNINLFIVNSLKLSSKHTQQQARGIDVGRLVVVLAS